MKNATPHQGGYTTAPAVFRRREREHLADVAAGGDTPRPPRRPANPSTAADRRQTGRRYGPPPAFATASPAEPMGDRTRAAVYGLTIVETHVDGQIVERPEGGTARQRRQWTRMHRRHLGAGEAR